MRNPRHCWPKWSWEVVVAGDFSRLGRLRDSNAVFSHFNEYSNHCFAQVSVDFTRHTRLLKFMKSDMDYIFQKLGIQSILMARPRRWQKISYWTFQGLQILLS